MKDNYNDLKELFEDWKEAHKKDDHWLDTFPKCPCCGAMPPEDFKISFTYDGYLTDNKEIKLLFIGRESNVSADIKAFGKAKECFWMKDGKGKVRENYEKYLKEIAEALHVDYKNCAYMNINKRGGYGACSYDSLLNYVNVYRKFIKNEIEIISPKKVVFLGLGNYTYRKEIQSDIKFIDEKIDCYVVHHPSASGRGKSVEKLKNNSLCPT